MRDKSGRGPEGLTSLRVRITHSLMLISTIPRRISARSCSGLSREMLPSSLPRRINS
jgi:hypothetical protein